MVGFQRRASAHALDSAAMRAASSVTLGSAAVIFISRFMKSHRIAFSISSSRAKSEVVHLRSMWPYTYFSAAFFAQDLAGVGHLDIAQRVFVVAQFAFLQDCVRWYSEQRDFESFALDDSMIF